MSTTPKITGSLVTALAAIALAAPSAGAMPLRGPVGGTSEYDAGHASLAQETAAQQAAARPAPASAPAQDLRSADAKDAVLHPRGIQVGRGSRIATTPVRSVPVHVATKTPANDDGLPWLTIVLGATGAVALGGAAAGVTRSTRVRTRRARAVA
jgi:hypothetical protein